jgi:hypothetical protein
LLKISNGLILNFQFYHPIRPLSPSESASIRSFPKLVKSVNHLIFYIERKQPAWLLRQRVRRLSNCLTSFRTTNVFHFYLFQKLERKYRSRKKCQLKEPFWGSKIKQKKIFCVHYACKDIFKIKKNKKKLFFSNLVKFSTVFFRSIIGNPKETPCCRQIFCEYCLKKSLER